MSSVENSRASQVYVAGHLGLVGSGVLRAMRRNGYALPIVRTRSELDLTDQQSVRKFFETERPDSVILAAARVGGILANNSHPAGFLHDNLLIQDNVIDAPYRSG